MPQDDAARHATGDEHIIIPVARETITVTRRETVSDRVRVHVTVQEHDETVEALLKRQDVTVERIPLGTVVATSPAIRQEGGVIIVPVMEEVLVTETRLVLREELHIRIDETRRHETQVVRLRREHAEIMRDPGKEPGERQPEGNPT